MAWILLLSCLAYGGWHVAPLLRDLQWKERPNRDGTFELTSEWFSPTEAAARQTVAAHFDVVAGKEADEAIDYDELVLAVEIEGAARAYPLNMLSGTHREIFNDELGGLPIAATW